MQRHNLSSKTYFREHRRIGRGGKRGTFSGRGIKGQRARAGFKVRPAERDILKKIPKLRGYKFKSFRAKPAVINLVDLDKKFQSGSVISPETLAASGLVTKIKGKLPKIKILARGETKKKFTFKNVAMSRQAKEKANPAFDHGALRPVARTNTTVAVTPRQDRGAFKGGAKRVAPAKVPRKSLGKTKRKQITPHV